ncbi:hypothetical protein ACFE04_013201 [Oxalis oulophora]
MMHHRNNGMKLMAVRIIKHGMEIITNQLFQFDMHEINKLAKVKAQVSKVKGVMMENIEKVLDHGEKIELLVDKTEDLRSQAYDFRSQGTKMKRKMWVQNMKIKLIVFGIITALILIIYLSICHGFKC